jgi:hypothetical protein
MTEPLDGGFWSLPCLAAKQIPRNRALRGGHNCRAATNTSSARETFLWGFVKTPRLGCAECGFNTNSDFCGSDATCAALPPVETTGAPKSGTIPDIDW